MADIDMALNASNDAIEQLMIAGERTRTTWTSPRAPGKWSPSQIVEHVARSLEESANMAAGRPSKFPKLPPVVQDGGSLAAGSHGLLRAARESHSPGVQDQERHHRTEVRRACQDVDSGGPWSTCQQRREVT
jgi:hypothetical protein